MLEQGSLLTLFNATKADSGVFVCVANNGVPSANPTQISEKFYLLVRRKFNFLPHPLVYQAY